MNRNQALFALALSLLPLFATAKSPAVPTKVMIVGTYHMDNPGQDVGNTHADDVLSDKRQKQIADVVAHLAEFQPNVVAVEWDAAKEPGLAVAKYRDGAAGMLGSSRNEVVQLGFRLAHRLKLKDIFGIDVKGDFPIEALQEFAATHGQGEILGAAMAPVQAEIQAFDALLASSTVAAALRHMNESAFINSGNAFYRKMLKIGTGSQQPGAALVGAWEDRNLQICARLMQVTMPGDRAIVFFGAGHSYLLRQCVQQMPGYELVEATSFLPEK